MARPKPIYPVGLVELITRYLEQGAPERLVLLKT